MGYCVKQYESNFKIKKSDKSKALSNLYTLMLNHDHYPDDKSFRWLNGVNHNNWDSLGQALRDWRFEIEKNHKGDVIGIKFRGEKIGDEDEMFEAISNQVQDGSYIIMGGEYDRQRWMYFFEDGLDSINLPYDGYDQTRKSICKELIKF